jgi:putative Holliday junction resolvase
MRVVGIDYGRKRVGLALSDASGLLARPWKTIAARARPEEVANDVHREIERLRQQGEDVGTIVLGLPRRLSGEPNEQTPVVQALGAALQTIARLPVVLQDERLSSREAESLLARTERDWRRRKPLLDAAAAAVILQDYLDSR